MTFYCTTNIKDLEWEKFTNLCYLKTYELKALGCLFETISAFNEKVSYKFIRNYFYELKLTEYAHRLQLQVYSLFSMSENIKIGQYY